MLKKILTVLMILGLVCSMTACSKNIIQEVEIDEGEVIKVYKGKLWELFPDSTKEELYNKELGMDDGEIKLLGTELPEWTFIDYNGDHVQLPKDQDYILEVVGSWCGFCQALAKEAVENELYNEIPIYQVFLSAEGKDEIDSFYSAAETTKNPGIKTLIPSVEFNDWFDTTGIESVPCIIFVNKENKISLVHVGYSEIETIRNAINIAKNEKLYEMQIEDMSLVDFIEQQKRAQEYINNIDEVTIK